MTDKWIIKEASDFDNYNKNWEQLSEDILGCKHPLIHSDYVGQIIKYFAPKGLKLALRGSEWQSGMVLLKQKRIGVWETFFPKTGPFSFALIKNTDQGTADSSIISLIKSLPCFVCLFTFYKLDTDYLTVKTNLTKKNQEKIKFIDTIRIPIDRPFEYYWEARSKNLKRNITKKKNRLFRDNIEWSFHVLTAPDEMKSGVIEYGKLESSGWKGKAGTAVNINNHRGQFYVDMLSRFAARKRARIYQLQFGEKVVASALTVQGDGVVVILKIAYDESEKEYSPGMLMYYEVHKHLFNTPGVTSIEYYGKATERMQQWAVDIREIYHLNYYRAPVFKHAITGLRKLRTLQELHR